MMTPRSSLLPIPVSVTAIGKSGTIAHRLLYGLLFAATLLSVRSASGQEYTYFEGRHELFGEHRVLLQDQQGYLWGLHEGGDLFRYDGFEFRDFPVELDSLQGLPGPQGLFLK